MRKGLERILKRDGGLFYPLCLDVYTAKVNYLHRNCLNIENYDRTNRHKLPTMIANQ